MNMVKWLSFRLLLYFIWNSNYTSLLWLSTTSVAFHTILIKVSPHSHVLYSTYVITSPNIWTHLNSETGACPASRSPTLAISLQRKLSLMKALEARCRWEKTNKAILPCSTHMSGKPAWCAPTGPPPAPNAQARGTRRRGWWSRLGRRTGWHRWRRCQWSRAASPTGTACRESPDTFKSHSAHSYTSRNSAKWSGPIVIWPYPSKLQMHVFFGPSNFISSNLSGGYICTYTQKLTFKIYHCSVI